MVVNGRPLKRAKKRVTADLYDFLTFPGAAEAGGYEGPFRANVRAFLSRHARLPPPSSVLSPTAAPHLLTWRVSFRIGGAKQEEEDEAGVDEAADRKKVELDAAAAAAASPLLPLVVDLDVVEEDVARSRSVYCDQCRVVGWAPSGTGCTSTAEMKLNSLQNHSGEWSSVLPEAMEAEEEREGWEWEEGAAALGLIPTTQAAGRQHVKKRTLKNKGLAVGFDEKDLKNFVTGFHKRKKKRRKIAQKELQEKERLQRIEARKKRKLAKELALYGGALPAEEYPETAPGDEENQDDLELVDLGKTQFVSGTKTYESNGMSITVTTSEISREEEDLNIKHHIPKLSAEVDKSSHLPPKKKPFKRVSKQRSHHKKHKKPASKRKGEKKGRRR